MADQAWDLDYTGQTVKDADINAGKLPDGVWYKLKLVDVTDDNDSGAKFLFFQIVQGPLAGAKIKERLNNPRFADKPSSAEFARKKSTCYASRLGLVDDKADGKQVQASFSTAIGREFVGKLSSRKGSEGGEFQGLDFDLFPIGHPKLVAEAYVAVGLPVPAGAPHEGAAAKGAKTVADTKTVAVPAKDPAAMAAMMWGDAPAGQPKPAA